MVLGALAFRDFINLVSAQATFIYIRHESLFSLRGYIFRFTLHGALLALSQFTFSTAHRHGRSGVFLFSVRGVPKKGILSAFLAAAPI